MTKTSRLLVVFISFTLLTGFGPFRDKRTKEQEQQDIQDMRSEVLKDLYEEAPEAEQKIAESAGYAVFSNLGINLLVLSTGNGYGVAHNNSTGKDTYMKMYSAGVGIGYGVKDFRAVFIFDTLNAMNYFIEQGWQATAQTDAAAVSGEKGDAMNYEIEIAPNVKLYQMTENGLALQATLQGTKYVLDKDLN
ncbi:MAG TPA: hypothetical protein VJ984_13185 [Xanthomonadales bacterium]|nr:hypothetical protein [Xanthomonadales bacterium]